MKYYFISAKGGQGTTVLAAAFALSLADDSRRVLLVDHARNKDMTGVLGLSNPLESQDYVAVKPLLDFTEAEYVPANQYDDEVVDLGVMSADDVFPTDGVITLVTTACYLALRNATPFSQKIDRVILVSEDGRALTTQDVESVLGRVDAIVDRDPVIARSVDAGLLASRVPRGLMDLKDLRYAAR